jgi:hypothetical protein
MPRKQRRALRPDEPNLTVPLAVSYNERGVAGFTHTVTNSEDQRKVNVTYEPVKNQMTGKGTLTLVKRPGVTEKVGAHGTNTQSVFLIAKGANPIAPTMIVRTGSDINATVSGGLAYPIVIDPNQNPAFVDKTITYAGTVGTEYLFLQTRRPSLSFAQRAFYANLTTTWVEITDVDFTALMLVGKIEHMDGYFFGLDANNLVWNSDLNSVSSVVATSFIAKQVYRDRPVGLARLGKQIIAFGENTAEPFVNSGGTTGSPLSPVGHLAEKIGLVAPDISLVGAGHYYCTIRNKIYFVGREGGGQIETDTATGKSVGVYTYNGQSFEKISNPYLDKIFSEVARTSFYSVNSVSVNGQVAAAFMLTSPNAASQRSLLYFPVWKEWFEWTSTVFSTINDAGYFLPCGTDVKDKLYYFAASDNWQDNGTSYPWSIQFKHPGRNARNFMHMYGVEADTDTVANTLLVEKSDTDNGVFTTLGSIDMTKERKVLFGGSSFYRRHIRIGNTNARPCRIHNWLARID